MRQRLLDHHEAVIVEAGEVQAQSAKLRGKGVVAAGGFFGSQPGRLGFQLEIDRPAPIFNGAGSIVVSLVEALLTAASAENPGSSPAVSERQPHAHAPDVISCERHNLEDKHADVICGAIIIQADRLRQQCICQGLW